MFAIYGSLALTVNLGVVSIHGGRRLGDLVFSSSGNCNSNSLDNSGCDLLSALVLASLVGTVSTGLDTSRLEVSGVATVGDGNTSLGGGCSLGWLRHGVGDGDILSRLSVDSGRVVCLGLRSRGLVDGCRLVFRPFSIPVFLNFVWLLLIARLAEAGATVAGQVDCDEDVVAL